MWRVRSLRRRGRGGDFDGLELGGESDLDQFEILGMRHFLVPDTGRLMDARAGLGEDFADTLVVEFDPALDYLIHLQVE